MNNDGNNELIFVRFNGHDVEFLEPEEIAELLNVIIIDPVRDKSEETAYEEDVKRINNHKGGWLTESVTSEYVEKAKRYWNEYSGQYIGNLKALGKELMELYGITEIEAINILFNHNVNDYVNKYKRIKDLMP